MPTVTVCDVALDPRKGGMEATWTYLALASLKVGDAVVAPLGARSELGFVLRIYDTDGEHLGFPLKALRPLNSRVEGLALPKQLVDLVLFVSEEYLCPPAVAISPALPPGLRSRISVVWNLEPDALIPSELPAVQLEVVRAMRDMGGVLHEAKGAKMAPAVVKALKALRTAGVVQRSLRVLPAQEAKKGESLLRISSDAAKVERFLQKEGKRKPAQALTLMRLQGMERGSLSAAEIKGLSAVTDATLKALIQAGLLEQVDERAPFRPPTPPQPNLAQQVAIDAVVEAIGAKEFRPFLLFGVTGSGKTEVYLRAAAEVLRAGRQVLYVVPEIALAAQAIGLLRQRFGQGVVVLHSNLSEGERLQNWLKVRDGQASVVLGARSALFAPISNLGLVVVDEEHEQAYKQESAPRYHAKAVALRLAMLHGCPAILGSATPSIESFYEAEEHERDAAFPAGVHALTLLTLPERTASSKLPVVTIRDLGEGYRRQNPVILTDDLRNRMHATLERGQQVILFLNRRAYAPSYMCRDCGQSIECPNCSVALSFHRRDGRLRCHHCGYQCRPITTCPKCAGIRVAPFGVGTEKVEEAVAAEFPNATVGRLDRDVARKKGALDETLAAFRSGELQILVGTQIVAKGLDFPNVTLVGVIAADVSLHLPDFRASERTFQLLSQVAGRAGRGTAIGTVVIQTFNPEHPSVVFASTHEYLPFYETLKHERMEASYPPFRRLVNVLISGQDKEAVRDATGLAARTVERSCPGFQVLGPVDCAIERVMGKWRRHVLVKLPPYTSAAPIGRALERFDMEGVQLMVDVDPYTML